MLFALIAVIGLQLAIPKSYTLVPRWPLIGLELLLLAVLTWLNPLKLTNATRLGRYATWVLLAAITLDNTLSAVLLDICILTGEASNKAAVLLGGGGAIFVTNIIVFGIWYWELDRAGRSPARGQTALPRLHVPPDGSRHRQVRQARMAPDVRRLPLCQPDKRDGLLSTDTMPLARWAKGMMAVQSLVAVTTVALVIARAVNVLS